MTALSIPTTSLADGSDFPLIGFGTGGLKGPDGAERIATAIRAGYRLLDVQQRESVARRYVS